MPPGSGRSQERKRRGECQPEPDRRRQLEPRDDSERGDAGEAASEIGEVARERRQRGHLATHPLRERREQGRDADEEQREEGRALHEHHGLRGAAREIDAAGRLDAHLEAEEVNDADHRGDERGNQPNSRARAGASRQPTPMPRKLASRMKFEK